MSILLKNARIIAEGNSNNNKVLDILIEGGKIAEIGKNLTAKSNGKVIEADGLCVSAGWLDMQAASCDPGFEHKEDLDSLIACAAAGGFTAVCVHNDNLPAIHGKSQIEYILNKSRSKVVDIYPAGTVTVDAKGKDLSEMFDMQNSGAIAFSDHKNAIKDSGMLMRALQYSQNAGSFIITHCNDQSISHGGQMNEGEVSVSLGLKGIPPLAEELMVERNISVLEYTGGRIHFPAISTRGSVDLIKKAKAAGLKVTAGVAVANLLLDDSVLKEFDTNYKLDPPLRNKKDVLALRNAVDNGIIDVIVSDHYPQDVESKELEFDHAETGMISLQTAFPCAVEALKEESLPTIIKCLTTAPRGILGVEDPEIKTGADANLTLFTLKDSTTLTEKNNRSKSKNSPFFHKSLKGKVIGVIKGSKSFFN